MESFHSESDGESGEKASPIHICPAITDSHIVDKPSVTAGRLMCQQIRQQSRRQRSTTSFCRQREIVYTDVVVIGNGPSGIMMSLFLSGYWPSYTGGRHPDEMLSIRLSDSGTDKSIVEMDLDYLSQGLEGRSSNPVALLFDTLTHPGADIGSDMKSVLTWKHDDTHTIPHVVLGKKDEGGTWQLMEGHMQTLSLGSWMQLPEIPIKDWLQGYRSKKAELDESYVLPTVQDRATMEEICAYYMNYVDQQGLRKYFSNNSTVMSVERVLDVYHSVDSESGEQYPCHRDHSDKVKWEVRGYQLIHNECGEEIAVDFCYRAPNVILATGSHDTPNKLHIPGEALPYVFHSLVDLETVIKAGDLNAESDPVMIVGAGLCAADAILLCENLGISVIHVFRRNCNDPRIVLSQLPPAMYPEYHSVLALMRGSDKRDGYEPLAAHQVLQCLKDRKVVIRQNATGYDSVVKVSLVLVLIGSRPDLSFLPHNGKNLGALPGSDIDGKTNPIDVDPYSYQSIHECGIFAMGPLVGDNFVRFLRGGALGITSHLWKKRKGLL